MNLKLFAISILAGTFTLNAYGEESHPVPETTFHKGTLIMWTSRADQNTPLESGVDLEALSGDFQGIL